MSLKIFNTQGYDLDKDFNITKNGERCDILEVVDTLIESNVIKSNKEFKEFIEIVKIDYKANKEAKKAWAEEKQEFGFFQDGKKIAVTIKDYYYTSPGKFDKELCKGLYVGFDSNSKPCVFVKKPNSINEFDLIGNTLNGDVIISELINVFGIEEYKRRQELLNQSLIEGQNNLFEIIRNKELTPQNKHLMMIEEFETNLPKLAFNSLLKINALEKSFEDKDKKVVKFISGVVIEPKSLVESIRLSEYYGYVLKDFLIQVCESVGKWPSQYSSIISKNCLTYFDYDNYGEVGEYPAWEEYLSKFTPDEAKVFKAFMCSILDSENKFRQLLEFQDGGFTGKSVLNRVINNVLGDGLVATVNKDSMKNQFGFSKLVKARLVVIADNKNKNIIHSEWLHSITGGDPVDVEFKGKGSYSTIINAKMMIYGNDLLSIDTAAVHEKSRVILLKPQKTDAINKKLAIKNDKGVEQAVSDPQFEIDLQEQFKYFIHDCKKTYLEMCPRRSDIVVPQSVMNNVEELCSEDQVFNEDFLNKYTSTCDKENGIQLQDLKQAVEMFGELYNLKSDKFSLSNIRSWLAKNHKIIMTQRTVKGTTQRKFYGFLINFPKLKKDLEDKQAENKFEYKPNNKFNNFKNHNEKEESEIEE